MARSTQHDRVGDRAVPEPYLELPERSTPPRAAVLVLHGGKAKSRAPVDAGQLTVRRMQPFARDLAALGDDLAVAQLRYRIRGWNGTGEDVLADVAFALAALDARYGGVPTVLVGHSMGGRAALRSAGHPTVRGVVALAPWLPGTEPVEQLAGRDVVGAARHPRSHDQPARVGAVRHPGGAARPARGVPARAVERSRDAVARLHLAPAHRGVRRRHRRRRAVRTPARARTRRGVPRRHRRGRTVSVDTGRRRVAVVGAGVAGLTAAYVLQREHDVTLYEAEARLGGHAHTHDVETPDGRIVPIDSGFIVHNLSTYPNLLRLFGELGVETQPTDMSMSVRCDGCGLEYAGAKGFGGIFAQAANVANPRFLRMLVEVKRFHRAARRLLDGEHEPPDRTADT